MVYGGWTHSPVTPRRADVLVLPGEELTSALSPAVVGLEHYSVAPVAGRRLGGRARAGRRRNPRPSSRRSASGLDREGLQSVDGVEVAHPQKETSADARRDFRKSIAGRRRCDPASPRSACPTSPLRPWIGACRRMCFARGSGRRTACRGCARDDGCLRRTRKVFDRLLRVGGRRSVRRRPVDAAGRRHCRVARGNGARLGRAGRARAA